VLAWQPVSEQQAADGDRVTEIEALPDLPATAWTVLGMLSFGEGLSGYDVKAWADWSVHFFYWSPSYSQVYAELKKLERHGLATSTVEPGETRPRRVYRITVDGAEKLRRWVRESEVDRPVLKHPALLRLWLAHVNEPERLRAILTAHRDQMRAMSSEAADRVRGATREPSWAFTQLAMRWSERHYRSEAELADWLLGQLDETAQAFATAETDPETGLPIARRPGRWRRV